MVDLHDTCNSVRDPAMQVGVLIPGDKGHKLWILAGKEDCVQAMGPTDISWPV